MANAVSQLPKPASIPPDLSPETVSQLPLVRYASTAAVRFASEAAADLLGHEVDALRQMDHNALTGCSAAEGKRLWKVLRSGSPVMRRFEVQTADGETVHVDAAYVPVMGARRKLEEVLAVYVESDGDSEAASGWVTAIDRSQAVIEFSLDGTILHANENFLSAMGYTLKEVQGKHHRIFCDAEHADSAEYEAHWDALRSGEFVSGRFHRHAKDGSDIFIQASYNPIVDADGRPTKVVKFASDVTAETMRAAETESLVNAIGRSQAVIAFNLDGTIQEANENFLGAMGYTLEEIQGKHHRMFCDAELAASAEYKAHWDALRAGEFKSGRYRRVNKAGEDVFIQASYNPIMGPDGKPVKVVKFASDVTEQTQKAAETESFVNAIGRSQAVIAFNLDGTIQEANENFLGAMGYTLEEIQGKHHRMFCDAELAASAEYEAHWNALRAGEFKSGQFHRVNKAGEDVFIQASYNPIMGPDGKPVKVVKFASDITEETKKAAEFKSYVEAVERSSGVIEFTPDGEILRANENFCGVVGYTEREVVGQHHRMFCEREYAASREYTDFWRRLRDGQIESGRFRRVGNGDAEVWIQASYNPVFDVHGKVSKVVKFATDISAQVAMEKESQRLAEEQKERAAAMESDVEQVSAVVAAVAGGDLQQRIDMAQVQTSEMEALGGRLNGMLEDLERMAAERQKRTEDIQNDVRCLAEVVTAAAGGDLRERVKMSEVATGEMRTLSETLNEMLTDLQTLVGEVTRTAESFSAKAGSIAGQTTEVALQSERLGATSEEMSANVEELTASIASIAEGGDRANALANEAKNEAQVGMSAIRESLEAMKAIDHSSDEVADIVKVISEIASQTNLLAFNAAIEAARAGQHGRGFAVVADEVRKLAERSSRATNDISKLIGETTRKIRTGSDVSQRAAAAFEGIAVKVDSTYTAVTQIASAAQEQSTAAHEVNSGIQSVSMETERAANSAEEISRACGELKSSATELLSVVRRFSC